MVKICTRVRDVSPNILQKMDCRGDREKVRQDLIDFSISIDRSTE